MKMQIERWLAEIKTAGLSFPTEPHAGAIDNLWSLSFNDENAPEPGELIAFLRAVAEVRREIASALGSTPVTFYAWHDAIAGQLRFSTAQCEREHLPFGGSIALTESPDEIVRDFLEASGTTIPWGELEPVSDDASSADDPVQEPLRVWAVLLAPRLPN